VVAVRIDDLDPALVEAPVHDGAAVVGEPVDEASEVVDGEDRGRGGGFVVGGSTQSSAPPTSCWMNSPGRRCVVGRPRTSL